MTSENNSLEKITLSEGENNIFAFFYRSNLAFCSLDCEGKDLKKRSESMKVLEWGMKGNWCVRNVQLVIEWISLS